MLSVFIHRYYWSNLRKTDLEQIEKSLHFQTSEGVHNSIRLRIWQKKKAVAFDTEEIVLSSQNIYYTASKKGGFAWLGTSVISLAAVDSVKLHRTVSH